MLTKHRESSIAQLHLQNAHKKFKLNLISCPNAYIQMQINILLTGKITYNYM